MRGRVSLKSRAWKRGEGRGERGRVGISIFQSVLTFRFKCGQDCGKLKSKHPPLRVGYGKRKQCGKDRVDCKREESRAPAPPLSFGEMSRTSSQDAAFRFWTVELRSTFPTSPVALRNFSSIYPLLQSQLDIEVHTKSDSSCGTKIHFQWTRCGFDKRYTNIGY